MYIYVRMGGFIFPNLVFRSHSLTDCFCMPVFNLRAPSFLNFSITLWIESATYFNSEVQIFHLLSCDFFSYLIPFTSSVYTSLPFEKDFPDRAPFLNICSCQQLLSTPANERYVACKHYNRDFFSIYPSSASLGPFICKSSSFELRTRCAEFPRPTGLWNGRSLSRQARLR